MERRGGVAGNKSSFKIYAGAQITQGEFYYDNKDHKESGKDREEADPEGNAGVE